MRKLIIVVLAAAAAWLALERHGQAPGMHPAAPVATAADSSIDRAFARRQSNVQVQANGVVVRILADDNQGSRHQRFIVETGSGRTVLIAHNIDLAPRVSPLAAGDTVRFNGEYEWNDQGGILHWTHHDPAGRHEDGWIKHEGKIFQ